ncbi:MAG: hypothetical protein RBS55_05625 [Bacteroidales bacterium]|jgi:hypothetical protein|nr:hypothetical protein [Bacteroidales bacterium]
MESIIIKTKSKTELNFWMELIRKTGTDAIKIKSDLLEDEIFKKIIDQGMETAETSRDKIMKALQG